MIQGETPAGSANEKGNGHAHTGVMGDRHGIAAEDNIKEKHGIMNAH
jgi:Amt family ammonium transporter